MSDLFTVRRDRNGYATHVVCNGYTLLHLIPGTVRNEDNVDGIVDALNRSQATSPYIPIPDGTEGRVIADIAKRQATGKAKYGTTVEANPLPLREWLQHAYEESLDHAVYLKRAMEEMDKDAH